MPSMTGIELVTKNSVTLDRAVFKAGVDSSAGGVGDEVGTIRQRKRWIRRRSLYAKR